VITRHRDAGGALAEILRVVAEHGVRLRGPQLGKRFSYRDPRQNGLLIDPLSVAAG